MCAVGWDSFDCSLHDLSVMKLPAGFSIQYYASNVPNARQMTQSKKDPSILYVGSMTAGNVYAVVGGEGTLASEQITILTGLNSPNGVAWHEGSLYVAENHQITRYDSIDMTFRRNIQGSGITVLAPLPQANDGWHGWHYIKFDSNGDLILPLGAPCNYCLNKTSAGDPVTDLTDTKFATVTRVNVSNPKDWTVLAHGVRNSVGVAESPVTGKLWFTENGRDKWSPELPQDELNRLDKAGQHFGFPFCYGGTQSTPAVNDPLFNNGSCSAYTPSVAELGPHVAPLGLTFVSGNMFPAKFTNSIVMAQHGSWNRPAHQLTGYRLMVAFLDAKGDNVLGQLLLAEGWLAPDKNTYWGRPVDVLVDTDGALLVSDDFSGAIFRISYKA
jgi:glucose/arabinose dehydrogenase